MIALHAALAFVSLLIARKYVRRHDGYAFLVCIVSGMSFGANTIELFKLVHHG